MKGCCASGCPLDTSQELIESGLKIFTRGSNLLCAKHCADPFPDSMLLWDPERHLSHFRMARSAAQAIATAVWDPVAHRSLLYPDALSAADAQARADR